jgi:hypothetical protein
MISRRPVNSAVGALLEVEAQKQIMNNKAVSLVQFWEVVSLLNSDAQRCMERLDETPKEDQEGRAFWRRMYARAVFALVDGATYRMMYHAYVARDRRDVTFSLDELTRLEKYYDFDQDQEASVTFSQNKMLETIRFAFNAFARVHYSDYILPLHDPNWILLQGVARIKEGLQYPKDARELEVSGENIEVLAAGLLWFVNQMLDLLEKCQKDAEAKLAQYESGEDEVIM